MENYYNIDKTAHYFVLMHPLEGIPGFITFTSSNSREKWVECKIVEDRYKVDDHYKVELQSIEPGYGSRVFYQMDFNQSLESGYIVKKTSNKQHVEEIIWTEPLCGDVTLKHSAYLLID
jgi:hypothetical protein